MSEADYGVLWLSVHVATGCVVVSLPPALVLGAILARYEFPGKAILDGVCHLPLVLPPVVTGYVLLVLFGRRGVIGEALNDLGVHIAFDWKGAVLASAVVGFPLMLRAIRQGVASVDPRLEGAARTLGAKPLYAFCVVTLRLAAPAIAVGCLLSFARSLGEFGATITFVSNIPGETQTLPLAVFSYLNQPDGEASAWRLVLVSIGVSFVALILSDRLSRRLDTR